MLGAAAIAGATVDTELQQIERSGFATQSGFKLKLGEGNELEATLIVEAGIDDIIVATNNLVSPEQTTPAAEPSVPADNGKTLVVTPENGLTLRGAPVGSQTSVFQHGTFLTQTGETVTAIDGTQWAPVSGSDVNDQPVSGYVHAALTNPHDSSLGAMDATGRINPILEYQRHDQITVQHGANLWGLAQEHGVSFEEMVTLNEDHLISTDLIFTGDTVYLPGTAKGPEQPAAIEPEEAPASPSESTETTASGAATSSTDSGSLAAPAAESTNSSSSNMTTESMVPDASSSTSGASSSGEATETVEAPITITPAAGTDTAGARQATEEILVQYQVTDDAMTEWSPKLGPLTFIEIPFVGSQAMTQTEADLLDELGSQQGILGLRTASQVLLYGIESPVNAYHVADQHFPKVDETNNAIPGAEDGHNDAFRHAFYNAMLTKEFGVGFAESFATAHEGRPGNPDTREAMDLYNNELGRRIATQNPDASPQELAELVYQAVIDGDALVISGDASGNLAYSDQIAIGETGSAERRSPREGVLIPPEWNQSN